MAKKKELVENEFKPEETIEETAEVLDFQVVEQTLPVIKTNFDFIKAALNAKLPEYKRLIVTEENLQLCKNKQKELSGIRTKIDTYRKSIKKEVNVPVEVFEGLCKELILLVDDADKPLKDAIEVFDNKRKEKKVDEARELIKAAIVKHGLFEKYSTQLTVIDKYRNLSSTKKEVLEDIEQRAFSLKVEQDREAETLEIIQGAIDMANTTIKTPLSRLDFQRYIDMKMPTKDILTEISKQAAKIKLAENPPPAPVQETAAVEKNEPVSNTEFAPSPPSNKPLKDWEPKQIVVELRVTATHDKHIELIKFLKENGYNTQKLSQKDL